MAAPATAASELVARGRKSAASLRAMLGQQQPEGGGAGALRILSEVKAVPRQHRVRGRGGATGGNGAQRWSEVTEVAVPSWRTRACRRGLAAGASS